MDAKKGLYQFDKMSESFRDWKNGRWRLAKLVHRTQGPAYESSLFAHPCRSGKTTKFQIFKIFLDIELGILPLKGKHSEGLSG